MLIKISVLVMLTLNTLKTEAQPPVEKKPSTLLAFASDTQAPMWVETLWLKSNNNRKATGMVFGDILNNRPKSLFLLGDVVNLGYSERQWKPIDKYLKNLRDNNVEVNAILGNHEVMGQAKKGQEKFQQRFPNHKSTGYLRVEDSVAVVLLNSNFNSLTRTEDEAQTAWYQKTLKELDADPSILYVITTCHHSPYTNSKIVGQSTDVQKRFVPPFLASAKSKLFLSGHCHGFEHYQVGGKDFMVIGGGGGLHQPLRTGEGCLNDLACSYKPMFHYLTVQRGTEGLEVISYQLKKDFTGFDLGLRLEIGAQNVELAKKD
jgi:UDP-2,3-diacylglucosamine pyrophosphatase LpxH